MVVFPTRNKTIKPFYSDHNEKWTKQQFLDAGFPHADIPANNELSVSFSKEGLSKLREEREAVRPFSDWETDLFDLIVDWTTTGVPDDGGWLPPQSSLHRLSEEELKLTPDKLARFITSKL